MIRVELNNTVSTYSIKFYTVVKNNIIDNMSGKVVKTSENISITY